MAVSEQTPYQEFIANGTTTVFPLNFDAKEQDHLIVLVDDVEPQVGEWSFDFNTDQVTFLKAPKANSVIKIRRDTPLKRDSNYQTYNNSFRPEPVNEDLDSIWYKLQEMSFADVLLKMYVDRQDQKIIGRIDDLREYLLGVIRSQGIALDQLEDYYNYLMSKLSEVAISNNWNAAFIADRTGLTQQQINDKTVFTVPTVDDLLSLEVWENRTVFIPESGYYTFKSGVWSNTSVGFGKTILLDDIVPSKYGLKDCSASINSALKKYSGKGVRLIGNPNSKYLLQDTIDFTGLFNIDLDFNYATIIDDVRGTIGASGGRGKHTFLVYNNRDTKIKKIIYNVASTKSNPALEGIPTIVFWIGGQYLGGAMTSNVEISDFLADGHSINNGMVVSCIGELDGIILKRFSIKNGAWRWGCNFEYGLRPVDLEENLTLTNGRHPYNIYVENFRGENLPKCTGFLRTASCYNAKFFACTGFNVPNFIDYYSGDRGISRYSQNVVFELCKSKLDDTVTTPNYGVNIVVTTKDGSTQEPLEEWVNRDHIVKFSMCEFIGNYTENTTAVRFVGNAGKTIFEGCTFQRYYFGAWSQYFNNTNPSVNSPYSLVFRDCVFKKNKADIRQIDVSGVLYDHCTFKQRIVDQNTPYQIGLWRVIGTCSGTLFRHCFFEKQPISASYMRVDSNDVHVENCSFDLIDPLSLAISNTYVMYGRGNITNGKLTGDEETTNRIIGERKKVKIFTNELKNNTVNFNSSDVWAINSTRVISSIVGGQVGDIIDFRSTTSTANVTFNFNDAGASIESRLINKSGVNDNIIGLAMSRRYMKFNDGWREM